MTGFWDRVRAGHKARNDSPAYDDYKPKRDGLPADYGQHPLWCQVAEHDGPCKASTAAIGAGGVWFTVTAVYDRTAKNPRPVMTVQVGEQATQLDADEVAPVFGLAGSWVARPSLPRVKPAEAESEAEPQP